MDFTQIVIVNVFFLLDKGHEAEHLQKECLFLLYYPSLWRTPVNQMREMFVAGHMDYVDPFLASFCLARFVKINGGAGDVSSLLGYLLVIDLHKEGYSRWLNVYHADYKAVAGRVKVVPVNQVNHTR